MAAIRIPDTKLRSISDPKEDRPSDGRYFVISYWDSAHRETTETATKPLDHAYWAQMHRQRAADFRVEMLHESGSYLKFLAKSALWHDQQAQRLTNRHQETPKEKL